MHVGNVVLNMNGIHCIMREILGIQQIILYQNQHVDRGDFINRVSQFHHFIRCNLSLYRVRGSIKKYDDFCHSYVI